MLLFTGGFFFVELFYGIYLQSLALMSDAFHMLSDVIALIIGFMAVRISLRNSSEKYSYGWVRAEVLGAFMNACFLIGLCFTIILETIQRFVDPVAHIDGKSLLIVASIGLGINIVGLFIFGGHHGHSHGHDHDHDHDHDNPREPIIPDEENFMSIVSNIKNMQVPEVSVVSNGESVEEVLEEQKNTENKIEFGTNSVEEKKEGKKEKKEKKEKHSHNHSPKNINSQAAFLHILGDALGSIGVIFSGCIIAFTDWKYRFYIDPLCSLFIALIIIRTTIPMLKKCAKILLQGVPPNVDFKKLQDQLAQVGDALVNIHDLHIWQLIDGKNIGSCHVLVKPGVDFNEVCRKFKTIFHGHHIHSTTIQPEFEIEKPSVNQSKILNTTENVNTNAKCNEPICNINECSEARCCNDQKGSLTKRTNIEKLVVE